jgi:hypothetical protein
MEDTVMTIHSHLLRICPHLSRREKKVVKETAVYFQNKGFGYELSARTLTEAFNWSATPAYRFGGYQFWMDLAFRKAVESAGRRIGAMPGRRSEGPQ